MSEPPEQHHSEIASELESIYRTLTSVCADAAGVVLIREDNRNWLGVRSGLKANFDLTRLRNSLTDVLRVRGDHNIVQVVGDSGAAFSPEGAEKAVDLISQHTTPTTILEYGYTSQQYDANWAVGQLLDRQPDLAGRVIANVVEQSAATLSNPEWEGHADVRTFVLPYNEDDSPTEFGDDVWLSDGIMTAGAGDKLICLEGGIQAFEQAVNVLCLGISVIACASLRSSDESKFSAASLLLLLNENKSWEPQDAHATLETYLSSLSQRNTAREPKVFGLVDRLTKEVSKTKFEALVSLA